MAPKREPSASPSASNGPSTPKKARASTPKTPTKSSPTKAKAQSTPGSASKKMGSWSGEELRVLYAIMCPKKMGVKWDEVAKQIPGRDAKACNNKWSRMQGKITDAIESMGE